MSQVDDVMERCVNRLARGTSNPPFRLRVDAGAARKRDAQSNEHRAHDQRTNMRNMTREEREEIDP
jgi:hypothetical protein